MAVLIPRDGGPELGGHFVVIEPKVDLARKQMDVYAAEAESWKTDHNQAMACREAELLIRTGILAFDQIVQLDRWHRLQVGASP